MQSTEVLKQRAAESAMKVTQVPRSHDVGSLTAEHGEALLGLASIILADRSAAEIAVSQLLSHADSTLLAAHEEGTRRRLSRHLYLNCAWARLVSARVEDFPSWFQHSTGRVVDTVTRLRILSEQQRAAIALFLYGDHTYREIAELLALPVPAVRSLLFTGLEELRPNGDVPLAS